MMRNGPANCHPSTDIRCAVAICVIRKSSVTILYPFITILYPFITIPYPFINIPKFNIHE
ncbi:hypothetical protein [Prevotella denticola]|uniref:hypothetical protein n=1 Tax=Prevotella denticola TaxID=28129 RepID=UPI001C5E8DBE|nr:hypothetical protein [Prevotella denticola]MBW4760262.1 hypothetical protein [Prevotella denticola]